MIIPPRLAKGARIAAWTFLAILAVPLVLQFVPQLVLADHAFVVLSGSMEPLVAPGDVVFVRASRDLVVGDVITFHPSSASKAFVTHRILHIEHTTEGIRYVTKGDANEDPDPWRIAPAQVVGEYSFHIPLWGHLQQLVRSRGGYVAFVLIPASLILAREFRVLYKELDAEDRAKKAEAAASRELHAFLATLTPPDGVDLLFERLEREERGERGAAA